MPSFRRGDIHRVKLCLLVLLSGWVFAAPAKAQLSDGAVITPEFFEEIYQINPAGGMPTDLLNSPISEEIFGHHLEIVDEDTAIIASFSELFRFNFNSGLATPIEELSFNPGEITRGVNGELIAVDSNEVYRIDPTNGAETSLYTETFFGPSDAVVASDGNIYLTEFFDAIGVLTPAGNYSKIGDFDTNEFSHIDLGPDGFLYLSSTFGASFYRVNPATGIGEELDSDVFTFLRDLQVDASGDILFAGQVDSKTGVFRFDPKTRNLTTIVDNDTVNGGFFSPLDIAIFSDEATYASADFNQDGAVDEVDLTQLLGSFGTSDAGDIDNDGDTDGADVLGWQRQFDGSPGLAATVSTVPEPGTTALLFCSVLIGLLNGRVGRSLG